MKKWSVPIAALGAAAVLLAACSSSGSGKSTATSVGSTTGSAGASGNKSSATGVTANQVSVGAIWSGSGPGAPEYVSYVKGIQARFDQQNAQGGVSGRKLKVEVADDATSPAQDQTAAHDLVSKGVFAVIGASPVLFASAKYLQQQGLPVVGGAYDGPEWGQQPYTNMFSVSGNQAPSTYENTLNTGLVQFMKDHGATNVAALGYSISPSSTDAAKATITSARAVGLKGGYLNTSIPFGAVNVGPIVLAMKAAKVDAVFLAMDNNTNFAILTGAKQAGLNLKVPVAATGYGQSLLDDSASLASAQGTYFNQWGPPLSSAPEKTFRAALQQYAGFTGVPGWDWYEGWTNADLFIKGLQVAGQNPTRQSFMTNLHNVTDYTAGGLLPAPIDLSLAHFGQPPQKACAWYATIQGKDFSTVPATGQPVCGTRISG
jgi:branched-chain amino acid transport system substrate-binding protein